MTSGENLILSRRAFATGMTGSLAVLGVSDAARAGDGIDPTLTADLRDAALRGLARAHDRRDPVLTEKAAAVLAELERTDPESALLVKIYRRFDAASSIYWHGGTSQDQAGAADLATLHAAVHGARAVSFRYSDVEGEVTTRTVYSLALVHPPQGIKLVGWCTKRQDYRQFFVRALAALTLDSTSFRVNRLELLRGLVAKD